MELILKAIWYGIILNPYFIIVFIGNLIGVLYVSKINNAYKSRSKKRK